MAKSSGSDVLMSSRDSGAAAETASPSALPADEQPAPKKRGGRPKGSKNKATREIRAIAQKYTRSTLRRLHELSKSKNEVVAVKACSEILDRGHGRPVTSNEISGKDGAPIGVSPIAFLASLPE